MKKYAETVYKYNYRVEEAQNPYVGFMSFQHFRGEKLYSDIVVSPEAKMTETERVECYPVSPDAEENGHEEGYYPDTSIAYIRILWKEFEPERGIYNYNFIKNIIDEAKKHGQTLIFRLMAHSTRASDDVPEWLKSLVHCPQRPPMMRIKESPLDPLFIDLFLEMVRKFGERFDSDPTLDGMDISLPGAWGEGYKIDSYPDGTLERIVDTYIDVFKETQLIAQVGRPDLVKYALERGVHLGWRGDGMGDPAHLKNIYPPRVAAMGDNWKNAPVSFESYWWIGEWRRHGWDIDAIINTTLNWHISSFNAKSFPCPNEWKTKIDAWISKMGYHFVIDRFACPTESGPYDTIEINLSIDNVGVAPIYKKLPLVFRLSNGITEYEFDSDIDITGWLPGKTSENAEIALSGIASGMYDIEIAIRSPHAPVLYFATDAERDGAFFKVGRILIQ
jgi:hypothetical protein